MSLKTLAAAVALAALTLTGCSGDGAAASGAGQNAAKTIALTITSANGAHDFNVETAKTEQEQQRGLMFRTDIPTNGGMLFAPYPPGGGAPKEASFWMKNTPSALDILFIRDDGTIATIAANTIPYSEAPIAAGEPVSAVLEIKGGRAAELGIAEGDKVTWAGHGRN